MFFQSHFEAIETLKAAYLYQVEAMNSICSEFLITAIKSDNVCDIYEFASSYSFEQVEYHCLQFIDFHAEAILKSPGFLTLKKITVLDIIKRHTLNVPTEMVVFKAVITWSFNDCLRRGVDADNADEILKSAKPLLSCVRFFTLSEAEMADPDVDKYYKLLCSEDSASKRRSLLSVEQSGRPTSMDSSLIQTREYLPDYSYEMYIVDSDDHAVKNGETFCLRIEALKGRVFLTGMSLAFDKFVNSKNASCLYVALSATNVKTAEQVCARGAFMISDEEAIVKFSQPLIVKESESVEMSLKIKRAVNICAVMIKADSQIVLTQQKDLALKIIPSASTGETERSMFKGLKYFH